MVMICNNRQTLTAPRPAMAAPSPLLTGPAPMTLTIPRLPALSTLRALLAAACLLGASPSFAEQPASPAPAAAMATDSSSPSVAASETGATAGVDNQAQTDSALTSHDMSPWGMYQNADIVVRSVMIGLALASVLTWTIWLSKGFELLAAKRRLRAELRSLQQARSLLEAQRTHQGGLSQILIEDAQRELELSAQARGNDGIKERVSFRLERLVAASGRQMSKGTGVLATIGSTAPFVGLFGTVWGIMNSFIGIAKSQTTNLAVVAPGIAEALLATALGLVAAIPAVVIYNVFARSISGYKAQVADASAQVLLLVSRDLDLPGNDRVAPLKSAPHIAKVG